MYETALVCRHKRKYEPFKLYEAGRIGNPQAYYKMWLMRRKQRNETVVERYKEEVLRTGGLFCFGDTKNDVEKYQETALKFLKSTQRLFEDELKWKMKRHFCQ